eukprot:6188543-Pleurochrysis_carterae.AAC.8
MPSPALFGYTPCNRAALMGLDAADPDARSKLIFPCSDTEAPLSASLELSCEAMLLSPTSLSLDLKESSGTQTAASHSLGCRARGGEEV